MTTAGEPDTHTRCAVCRYETGEMRDHPLLCEDCRARVVPSGVVSPDDYALGYAAAAFTFAWFASRPRRRDRPDPVDVAPSGDLSAELAAAGKSMVVRESDGSASYPSIDNVIALVNETKKDHVRYAAIGNLREKLKTLEAAGWGRGEPYDPPNGISFDGWPVRYDGLRMAATRASTGGWYILAFRWVAAPSPCARPLQESMRIPVPDEVIDFIRLSCNRLPRT